MLFWIVILLLFFYLNIPIPKNATEPWKLKFTAILMKIQGDLVFMYAFLRRKSFHVEMRAQLERLMEFLVFFQPRIDEIEDFIHILQKMLSKKTFAVVVSVEYRLAPENTFPAGFDDCVDATKYFLKNSAKYNVDPNKIGLAGDSTGGNLAMTVALKLALEPENDIPNLAFAVLINPCLQARDFNLASFTENNTDWHNHCYLTRNAIILFNNWYMFGNDKYLKAFAANTHVTSHTRKQFRNRVDPRILQGKSKIKLNDDSETDMDNMYILKHVEEYILNPYFSPLISTDEELGQLPMIYLITCEYDPLRDEGFILSERLKGVGNDLEHLHLPGSEHGVLTFPYYSVYKTTMDKIARYIQTAVK